MKKFKDVFAEIVSRILDPVWEIPLAILLAVGFAATEGLRWRFLGLLLFVDAVVPFIFFLTMLRHRQLVNWDMQRRGERVPIYAFTLICHLAGLWLAHELGKTELVSVLSVFYLIGISFALITMQWKISLHSGVNAGLFTLINLFYGWQYIWLYSLLLLVMWARVYQKHHTWEQVIAGAVLGGGMVGLGLGLVL
jgi:membrane-associated phospholipid phosphatase